MYFVARIVYLVVRNVLYMCLADVSRFVRSTLCLCSMYCLAQVVNGTSANMSSTSSIVHASKKPRIEKADLRALVAHDKQTKTSLADTLNILQKQGRLVEGVTRRELREASEHHAKQDTPYGKVVQRVELNTKKLQYLDYVNPFAFLYYLTMISESFATLMHNACQLGRPLRLIIYADEMNPGNPFRPEKSRTLQCVYWAFADWPAHVLSRTFAWPVLCLVRSSVVGEIEGGMSYLCRVFMRMVYPEKGHSLARGVMLNIKGAAFLVCATFAGFLCDLKGHKENLEWKGTGGNVVCLTCMNVDARLHGCTGNVVGIDCHDPKKFIPRSNSDVFVTVDELTDLFIKATSKTKRDNLQTEYGFNVCPNGLLWDVPLREIFRPVDHTLRDPMHTMVGDGVANSVLGETLAAMKRLKYPMDSVRNFMMECTLPSKYGRAHRDWLRDSRLKLHTLTSFSGIILTLVPILYLYMLPFCQEDPRLASCSACVSLVHHICGILFTGADKPMEHLETLKRLIPELHEKFVKEFTKYKPKLHHMQHIIDHMEWLEKLITCFVTERKHKVTKAVANYCYKSFTSSLLKHDLR